MDSAVLFHLILALYTLSTNFYCLGTKNGILDELLSNSQIIHTLLYTTLYYYIYEMGNGLDYVETAIHR